MRGTVVLARIYNGTLIAVYVYNGAPCVWTTYRLDLVPFFSYLSFKFDAGNQSLVFRRFFAIQYAEYDSTA